MSFGQGSNAIFGGSVWNCFLFILAIYRAIAANECLSKGEDSSTFGVE